MAYPPYDYTARHNILVGDVVGYRAGDGMYAQVVDDLGLVLGEDVDAARTDLLERPAESAKRAAWLEYVLAQDPTLTRDDADDMTRADLIARVTPTPAPKASKSTAKPSTDTTDAAKSDS